MPAYGLKTIDDAVHDTNAWLNDLDDRIGWENKQKSYRLLRSLLHVLRDHLSADEAAQLSAQLPVLVRGIFFEGWDPSKTPVVIRSAESFIDRVQSDFASDPLDGAPELIAAGMAVLRSHVSNGQMDQVECTFAKPVRALFS